MTTAQFDMDDGWPDPLAELDIDRLRHRRTAKWSTYDDDVIPAWIADADAPICPPVREAIDALLDRGDLTYPSDAFPDELTAVFVDRMERRYGWRPDPGRIVAFSDVEQAVSLAVDRLTAPGDAVLLHTPAYPPFLAEFAALGRRVVGLPFESTDAGWSAPLDAFVQAVDDGARVLVLVNPHNPLGVTWARDDLSALAEVVVARDLIVISDEIYGELTLDDHEHVPFASLGEQVEARTLTVTSVAKSHNLAGVRCAVAHVGRRLEAIDQVSRRQIGQVSNIGFAATVAAWRDGDDWLDAYCRSLTERRDRLAGALAGHLPNVGHVPPQAAFLAWLDCRPLGLPTPPEQFFADRARVALGAGEDYGPGGEGRVRVNLATSTAILDEIVERMVTAVDIWRASR